MYLYYHTVKKLDSETIGLIMTTKYAANEI